MTFLTLCPIDTNTTHSSATAIQIWTGRSGYKGIWNIIKHPGVVGKYINDLVYERIAPFVLDELRKKNPVVDGRRKHKHHQFLTEDVGIPALMTHLSSLVALARAAGYNCGLFMELVDRAYPKPEQQLRMLYPEIFLDVANKNNVQKNDDFDNAMAQIASFEIEQ